MTWDNFIWFAVPAMLLWLGSGIAVCWKRYERLAGWLSVAGTVLFACFIAGLWVGQQRPPLRTMGETRLWYSFFLALVGYVTYRHWRYSWLLSYSSLVACVFVCVNLFRPEIHSTNLMPALQSYWFVPHVTVYILSYALFGAATIASVLQLRKLYQSAPDINLYKLTDNLVYIGFGFLMLGMLMGCVWAKAAWGTYWSWDPKETWAFVTAVAYLAYIHLRLRGKFPLLEQWLLPVAFLLLMITWIGVNYLPSARGSIHVY